MVATQAQFLLPAPELTHKFVTIAQPIFSALLLHVQKNGAGVMDIIAVRQSASTAGMAAILDNMYRIRSKIFQNRLGWDVSVENGQEYDEYDALQPTYILAVSPCPDVLGCARLLPALGPTMLANTFPQLLGDNTFRPHSAMVESSRFCVDTADREGRGARFFHNATLSLFAGIIEWCLLNNMTEIATATDVRFERILRRAGWPMHRLGAPRQINETLSVAGVLPADRQSFERLRPADYHSHFFCPANQPE